MAATIALALNYIYYTTPIGFVLYLRQKNMRKFTMKSYELCHPERSEGSGFCGRF